MTSIPGDCGDCVVTVFRSRLRPDAEANGYTEVAGTLERRARSMPGFVDFKTFSADDGERVSIVVFDCEHHHNAWRDDPAHRAAQRRGRREFYSEYSISVCRQTYLRTFTAPAEPGRSGPPPEEDARTVDVEFSTNLDRVDRDWLWHQLTEFAYWAKYRTRDMFEQQLDGAWRLVGAYDSGDGRMVGFARAFSDGAAMAYLADVYVDPRERGRGIGSGILRVMIDQGPGRDFRWMLHTNDAHTLYTEFGFAAPDSTFMERDVRLQNVRT